MTCPEFQIASFKHLVFVFGGSGIIDTGYGDGVGWSRDVYDGSSYADAANEITTLTTELKSHGYIYAFACKWRPVRVCVMLPPEECEDKMKEDKSKSKSSSKESSAAIKNTMPNLNIKLSRKPICQHCYTRWRWYCPFNSRSELMVIGFSDGGGFASYLNYGSTLVTKGVAIDFWNYNSYDAWLEQPGGLTGGITVDLKIYTACESPMFDSGPLAIVPKAALPAGATTYLEGAGLSPDIDDASVYTATHTGSVPTPWQPGATAGSWWEFKWLDKCAKKKLHFFVHGLDSAVPITQVPLSDAEDSYWLESTDDSAGLCNSNVLPDPIHSNIQPYIPLVDDIYEWLSLAAFGTCSTGRRLEEGRELKGDIETKVHYDGGGDRQEAIHDHVRGKSPYTTAWGTTDGSAYAAKNVVTDTRLKGEAKEKAMADDEKAMKTVKSYSKYESKPRNPTYSCKLPDGSQC